MADTEAREALTPTTNSQDHLKPGVTGASGAEELVRSFLSAADVDDDRKRFLFCSCTGNVMVLWLTTFLFALITTVQAYFGGIYSKPPSADLLNDCNSMAVDTMTYFLNIGAEVAPLRWKRKLQLVVPILSLSVLTVLTVWAAKGAIKDIEEKTPGSPDIVVVFAFGVLGLLFDIISIYAFCLNKRSKKEGDTPVNMMAAFMHVGADFIRSATTTVEGVILMTVDGASDYGVQIDAYCCLVITAVIIVGVLYGAYEVIMDITKYCRTGE